MDKKLFLCITALCLTITTATSDEDLIETENIECKQDGFLPHPTNCRSYYWCSLRRRVRAIILECEPNEIFDTQSQKCTYPNLSTRIECGGTKQSNTRIVRSPAQQQQQQSNECNKDEFVGDEDDCNKFYRCVGQEGGQFALYEFSCAPGTVWDSDISSCNHKWAVKGACGGQGLVNSPPKGEYTEYPVNEQPYPIYPQQPPSGYNPSYPSQSQEGSNYNWQQSQNEPPKETKPDQTYGGSDNPNPINGWPQNGYNPTNEYNPPQQHQPSPPPTSPKPEQTSSSDKNEGSSSVPPVIDNEINSDSTECQAEGFLPDPKDCTKFYRCVENGKRRFMKYEFTCGQGTVWDSQINACNHAWAVRKDNCKYKVDQSSTSENGNETNGEKPDDKEPIGEGGSIIDENKQNNSTLPTEEPSTTSTTTEQIILTSSEKNPLPYEEKETTNGQNTTIGQTNSTSPNQEISYECTKEGFIPDKTDCKKFYRCVQQNKRGFIKYEFSCGQGTVWDTEANTCNFPWATRNKCGTAQESGAIDSSSNENVSEAGELNETTNGNVSIPSYTENYTDKGPTQIDQSTVNNIDVSPGEKPTSSEQTSNITSADKYDNCKFEGFIGDSKNCKKFYRCVANENNGFTKYEFTCGEGTVWDTELDTCNYAWAVKGSCGYKDVGSEESSTAGTQNGTSVETQTPSTDSGNMEYQSEVSTLTGDSSEQSPTSETTTKGSPSTGDTSEQIPTSETTTKGSPSTGDTSEQIPTSETTTKGSSSESGNNETTQQPNIGETSEQSSTTETTTKGSSSTGDSSEQIPTSETTTKESSSESGNNETTQQPSTGVTSEQSPTTETTTKGSSSESGKNETYTQQPSTGDSSEQTPVTGSTITVTTIIVDITTASTVETDKNSTETSPTNQNVPTSEKMKCTKEGFFPNLEHCNKFYRCVSGEKGFIKYEFDCAGGTIWDPDLDTCNHPYAVTNKQCEQGSQQQQTKNECTTGGYFADSQDCKKFYRCVDNGKGQYAKYEFRCINDTLWDPNTLSCNYAWATRNTVCGHRGETEPPPKETSPVTPSTTENETKTEPTKETSSGTPPTTEVNQQTTEKEITEGHTIGVTEPFSQPSEQTTTTEKLTTSSVETTTLIEDKEKETTSETSTNVDVGITETTSSSSESTDSSASESTVSSSSESTVSSSSESTDSSTSESTDSSTSESTDSSSVETSTSTDVSSTESLTTTDSSSVETSPSTDVSSTDSSTSTDISSTETPSTDSPSPVTDSSQSPQTVNETTPCPISQLEGYQIALLCPTGFKRHPKYCNLFYQCTSNPNTFEINVLVISCPGRRIYDDLKIQCLPPDETDQQCNGEIAEMEQLRKFGNVVSPMEMEIQEPLCPNEGNFPLSTTECNKNFIKCEKSNNRSVNGFLYQCPENFSYWPVSKKCEKLSPALPCNANPEERNLQIPVEIEKNVKIDVRRS